MKLSIKYKKRTLIISLCVSVFVPFFIFQHFPNKNQAIDAREIIVAWSPASKQEAADSYAPTAFSSGNHTATLTRSDGIAILSSYGNGAKEIPQHAYYSRGWGADSQWWQLSGISTLGFENVQLSFWTKGSATGPKNFTLEYSIDGNEWYPLTNSNNTLVSYSISAENKAQQHGPYSLNAAVNNQGQLHIRFINANGQGISADTVGSTGTNYIADITMTAVLLPNDH